MKYFLPILFLALGALALWLFLKPNADQAKSKAPTSPGYQAPGSAIFPQPESAIPNYIAMPNYILLNNNLSDSVKI